MGMDTEFKVGDKVIATTPFLGEKKDRDGIIRDVQPNKYAAGFTHRVEVVVAGDTTYYWLTADKLRLAENTVAPLAQPVEAVEQPTSKDEEDAAIIAIVFPQEAEQEVKPPADPPKKERIRRTKEEIALGIPPEQVPAYRADPSSWSKRASGETDFNNTIEKALDDHWEDKAQEYLEPPAETPEQIAQRLGWIGFYEKEIGYIYKHVEHSELVLLDEGDWTIAVNDSDASHKCTWSGDEDFRMWLMRCTERIEELLDGGVCTDNDLKGDSKTFFQEIREELNPLDKPDWMDAETGDCMLPSTKEQEEMLSGLGLSLMDGAPDHAIYTNYNGTSVWFKDGKIMLHYDEDGIQRDCIVLDASSLKGDVETALKLTKKSQEARLGKTGVEPAKEEVQPDWEKCMKAIRYDFEFLGAPPDYRIVGRQKVNGQRSYVVLHPDQPVPFFYPSVTTIIDAVIPKDKALEAWAIKEFRDAKEKSDYMDMKAAYGTVVHGAIADLVNGVLPDFEDYEGWHTYMLMATGRNGHSRFAKTWTQGVQKSVLSVVKWIQDYQVRILAMELPLCHRGNGTAGQIDFLVERNAYVQKKTGQFKEKPPRVIAVDDIKTGNSSDMYVPQLGMYGEIVEHNFPALKGKIEAYGIIVPTNWKREPKCKFTDKTAKVKAYRESRLQMHLDLFRKDMKPPRGVQTLFGKPAIDMDISKAVGWKPLETVWMDKIKAGDFGSDDDVIVQEEEQEEEDDD